MSSSNSSLAIAIADVRRTVVMFVHTWTIIFFPLGMAGHALNIYIFTRPKFRHNPCVRYFLASAISGYAIVIFTIPVRWLETYYGIQILISSLTMCQILSYLFACVRVLPSWFISLASIDRFLSSSQSATVRGWSNLRVATRAILATLLFICLAYIHVPFFQAITYPQRVCTITSSTYQGFYGIWNLVFLSWIPSLCMLAFGLLIIRHIRQGRRRIAPQNQISQNQISQNHKKTDRQLIQMLFIQSFVFCSTTMTFSVGLLYISITSGLWVKNDLDKATDARLTNILNYISLTGPCVSFYIFTLSSQLFRHELIKLFYWRQALRTVTITNTGIPLQTKN